jgi:6-pyruvoyl-tetrahydropterin synthase
MIMNYYQLTREVNELIVDRWDHRLLNDIEPFTQMLPTAENMVLVVHDILRSHFNLTVWTPTHIRVQETDKTYAEWRFSD